MTPWLLWTAAHAATLTVGPSGDYRNVGPALEDAADGDVITIEAGEYRGNLTVDVDVTIRATDPADRPILIARDGTVMTVTAEVTLEHLVFAPGGGRGIEALADSRLTATDIAISGVDTDVDGGAIRAVDAFVRITDSTFVDNRTSGAGGHVHATRTDLGIDGSMFEAGDATFGGAVRVSDSTVTVAGSVFDGNIVDRDGGALYALGSDVTVTGSRFDGNSTRFDDCGDSCEGGALRFGDGSTWLIEDCVFDGNFTSDDVGGALVSTARSGGTVRRSAFTGNRAIFGGAIYLGSEGDVAIEDCSFEGNSAVSGEGGAIRWRPDAGDPTLRIERSGFVANIATARGGAIGLNTTDGERGLLVLRGNGFVENASTTDGGAVSVEATARLEGVGNVFCRNRADLAGGGVRLIAAGVDGSTWRNNIFVENESTEFGGGMHFNGAFEAEFVNNHVLGNESGTGAGVRVFDTTVAFVNNLVAWNTGGDGLSSNGRSGRLAYSLFFENTPADVGDVLTPDDFGDGVLLEDPRLIDYTPGGGCEQVVLPMPVSPVIDAGDPGIEDPDGSRSDIGAFGGPDAPEGALQDEDGDGFFGFEDCDDTNPDVYPGAPETCDGVDQDCDGLVDVGATDGGTWYLDVDRDGSGDPATEVVACDVPAGHVTNGDDCDDTNAAVTPGAAEICDGVDQDCNGAIDDGLLETWFADADGDGFGDEESTQDACRVPVGFVAEAGDCDDADANAYPGAPDELGDDVDQDCDGEDGSLEAAGKGGDGIGCGCATGPAPGAWPWLLLAVLGLRRR